MQVLFLKVEMKINILQNFTLYAILGFSYLDISLLCNSDWEPLKKLCMGTGIEHFAEALNKLNTQEMKPLHHIHLVCVDPLLWGAMSTLYSPILNLALFSFISFSTFKNHLETSQYNSDVQLLIRIFAYCLALFLWVLIILTQCRSTG